MQCVGCGSLLFLIAHFCLPVCRCLLALARCSHITVLYIDKEESVKRQMRRGEAALHHNEMVANTGIGERKPVRETDLSPVLAAERYKQFKEQVRGACSTTHNSPRSPLSKQYSSIRADRLLAFPLLSRSLAIRVINIRTKLADVLSPTGQSAVNRCAEGESCRSSARAGKDLVGHRSRRCCRSSPHTC